MKFWYNMMIPLILFAVFIILYFRYKFTYWKRKGVEYLTPSIPFGNMKDIFLARTNMETGFEALQNKIKGPFGGVYSFTSPILIVKDPNLIKLILVKDFHAFVNRGYFYNAKNEPYSGHLFRLPANEWKFMRNKLTPSFTPGKLKMMYCTIAEVAEKLRESLEVPATNSQDINIEECTTIFGADIIASVVFGLKLNSFCETQNDFLKMAKELFERNTPFRTAKLAMIVLAPEILNFLTYIGLRTVQNKPGDFINSIVKDVMAYRQEKKVFRNDIMQLLIQLKNKGDVSEKDVVDESDFLIEKNKGLSIEQLSAQAYTFFFAGFETASTTINFLLYECALDPSIQSRIQQDIDQVLSKHDGVISYEAVLEMKYLDMAISETLRKYPVLSYLNRAAVMDYKIPGTNVVIKENTKIVISARALHYDEKYFPNPEKFDPERFSSPENITPYSYLPFGEGPRNCIGKKMGLMMVATAIISMLKDYTLSVCSKTEIPLIVNKLAYTRRSITPITLKIEKRHK